MSTVTDIIAQARKKQLVMDSILTTTKDIDVMFSENNSEGADKALDVRMDQIQEAMRCDEEIGRLIDSASLSESLKLEKITKLQIEGMELSKDENILYELCRNIRSIADRTVEIDKRVSQKIIGKSSIYSEN